MELDDRIISKLRDKRLIVAVSGGSDSVALLHLLHEQGFSRLEVASVNHQLRAEAAAEQDFVAAIAARLGLPFHRLSVKVAKTGNLQNAARQARYQALADCAIKAKAAGVILGHTADDQAETFLMNAFRGSSIDGLSAMPMMREISGVAFYRPMLALRRRALQDWLRARGIEWVSDPSNDDARFDRVKLRRALGELEAQGFSLERLAQSAANLAAEREFLSDFLAERIAEIAYWQLFGIEIAFDRGRFCDEARGVQSKILGALCRYFGQGDYMPRREGLMRIADEISHQEKGGATLAGTGFSWSARRVRVFAEPAHLPPAATGVWNGWQGEADQEIMAAGADIADRIDWRQFDICYQAAQSLPVDAITKIALHQHPSHAPMLVRPIGAFARVTARS